MDATDPITSCAEQECADETLSEQPYEFETLEPVVEELAVPVRIEFASRLMDRDQLLEVETGELIELEAGNEDPEECDVDSPEAMAAQEVVILAGDRPIASGVIVVIDDQLGVKVTQLNF